MKDRGYYVQYVDKQGKRQKAMVHYSEQEQGFKNIKKLFVRLINDDMTFKTDPLQGNKKLVSLVDQSKCLIIGYFD